MANDTKGTLDVDKAIANGGLFKMAGPTKAAIMLVTLGSDACAQIFKSLAEEDVEILTSEIAKLDGITPEIREKVLEEFHQMAVAQKFILQGGVDYARTALEAAVGPRRAKEIMEKVATTIRVRLCIQPSARSWRIAASTIGYPVIPSHQAWNFLPGSSYRIAAYVGA